MKQIEFGRAKQVILDGKRLQEKHPEIRNMRLSGKSYREIETYLLQEGVPPCKDLKSKIGYAIRGHPGGLKIEPFEGLIIDEEARLRISKALMSNPEVSRRNVIKRGYVPWDDSFSSELGLFEEVYLNQLIQNSKYQYSSGKKKGKPNWKKIIQELARFFPERSIYGIMSRMRRKK